ncbi:transposase [Streptomyces canus]|uniref:transposase n=1 Tax=Streptomyces canus TaxID=58343 RepID=UPI0033AAEE3E
MVYESDLIEELAPTSPGSGPGTRLGSVIPSPPTFRLKGRGGTPIARALLSQVPKSAQPWAATLLRTVFEEPDIDAVQAQMRHVGALEAKFPKVAAHWTPHRATFWCSPPSPREIWRQVWSNNPQEPLAY